MTSKIKAGVVGGTGYTGVELLRLLSQHPLVDIAHITSRSQVGISVDSLFPNLRGTTHLSFEDPDKTRLDTCDIVFFATPNGIAMQQAPALLDSGVRVIDLAADFRIKDIAEWEKWYGMQHTAPQWVEKAIYGLPEVNREAIRNALLVANPGCYPTAVQLGLLPLLKAGVIETEYLIADAKSGVSGAGRKGDTHTLFAEAGDNFKAYGASGHRHLPEIVQGLSLAAKSHVGLTFTPHLTPMIRGIHATLYAKIKAEALSDNVDFQSLYETFYTAEPFVDILPPASHPETRSVRGSNLCRIGLHRPVTIGEKGSESQNDTLVILSVIDNLVKGAAGQAVQNMNLMFDFEETLGLCQLPILP